MGELAYPFLAGRCSGREKTQVSTNPGLDLLIRGAKPGLCETSVFSQPSILAPIFGAKYARNLDALRVPEALVKSIRILVSPAVFLAHPWRKCYSLS